jgi:hypothetical protein
MPFVLTASILGAAACSSSTSNPPGTNPDPPAPSNPPPCSAVGGKQPCINDSFPQPTDASAEAETTTDAADAGGSDAEDAG